MKTVEFPMDQQFTACINAKRDAIKILLLKSWLYFRATMRIFLLESEMSVFIA